MRSVFIVELARKYFRLADGAVGVSGHPVGLFALILTAVCHIVIPESQLAHGVSI
jgi:hypothetical protein